MNRDVLLFWCVMLLLPVVPVLLVYVLFEDQNYFELKDVSKGIVATGPIAAYVAIVYMGNRLFRSISNSVSPFNLKTLRALSGLWSFKSTSGNGTERTGVLNIRSENGRLLVSGTFLHDGRPAGNWMSEMAELSADKLSFVYELTAMEDGQPNRMQGICNLSFQDPEGAQMSGIWVLASEESSGSIICERTQVVG